MPLIPEAGGACTHITESGACTPCENPKRALPFEQQPRETSKAFNAFKVYLEMGPERSLSKTAKVVGKTERLMEMWSQRWGWQGRLEAYREHTQALERRAIESVAMEKAVEWWKLHEPVRREAWLEAERAITMVRQARERWEKSGRTPGFEGMARMLELAFKLKQFAAGMASEVKETHTHVTGKVSVEWEAAIRKAYQVEPGPHLKAAVPAALAIEPGPTIETPRSEPAAVVDVEEVKP